MSKEWILNLATNRWQLNFKRNVGPVAKWIRECSPNTKDEWKDFYYQKLGEEKLSSGEEHIEGLGKKLHKKIKNVVLEEIEEVEEQDCVEYLKNLVIERTYEGYIAEIEAIYNQLQVEVGEEIKEAPDEWDRKYGVDYFIEINGNYIGLQVKSAPEDEETPEWVEKWKRVLRDSHREFEKKYGGKVFMIFSTEKKKEIYNEEVIDEINSEIKALRSGGR